VIEAEGLVVSEVFGPTFQGEGPSIGQRAGFVRLGRCNLACTWCDTPYTWDWDRFDPAVELRRVDTSVLLEQLTGMGVPLVVITGGEPLLQQRHLVPLLEGVRAGGMRVEVETAGTIPPTAEVVRLVTRFNVSPKLASSGNPAEQRLRPSVLAAFAATNRAVFKFVVGVPGELDEVEAMAASAGLAKDSIWVMPEGTDAASILDRGHALAQPVLDRGWHLTTRLHVLLWGDQRGV
jgi:7-cyano-7-deazaguanosine (preQ0) biosynthesis protein QueE